MTTGQHELFEDQGEVIPAGNISILCLGIGGAGGAMLPGLRGRGLDHLHLSILDTDDQNLQALPIGRKHLLGRTILRGLGSGGDPEMGARAAEDDHDEIKRLVNGHEMVFIAAGMGGGTGGGAASVIARIAAECGCLVIAFVTVPFSCEGARRRQQAEEAIGQLRAAAHAVIPLPNDLLLQEAKEDEPLVKALRVADEWMARGVISIWRMLRWRGIFNIDFAALEKIFGRKGGKTLYGLGWGEGPDAAREALRHLDLCPLLQSPELSRWADRMLINIVGGPDLRLHDVRMLIDELKSKFGPEAFVTTGAVQQEEFTERVEVCVIGTTNVHDGRANARRKKSPVAESSSTRSVMRTERKVSPVDTQLDLPETVRAQEQAREGGDSDSIQREFPFDNDKRGHFDQTDQNLFEGVDLDTPTYQRRGIRISL